MKKDHSIKASIPFAKELAEKNIKLKVKQGSPLDTLFSNIDYIDPIISNSDDGISSALNFSLFNINDDTKEIVTNTISKIITKELNFFRSVVIPAINEYRDNVQENIDKYAVPNPAAGFKVVTIETPAPLAIDVLKNDIEYYSESNTIALPTGRMKLPELSSGAIKKILSTGSGTINTVFNDWIDSLPEDTLTNIWVTFFTDLHDEHPAYNKLRRTQDPTVPLIIYMLTKQLLNDPIKEARISLSDYNNVLYSVRDYAGALLASILRSFENYEKNKVVVLSSDQNNKEVKVYGPIYREWLADGGDIEAIYGIMVSNGADRFSRTVSALNENKDTLVKAWNKYVKLQAVYHNGIVDRSLRKVYVLTIKEVIRDMGEIESEIIENISGFKETLPGKVEDYVSNLTVDELKDVGTTADRIISEIRFSYSNASLFIKEMNNAKKANNNLTPQECASIATLCLVTDYLSGQISKV
jgi:hypothetical protein